METKQMTELTVNEAKEINGGSLSYTLGMLIHEIVHGFTLWA